MGISAFYSNITLLKLGESVYKRSIDHALDTAKILLLISTDPSYIESRWIKYEWESFHELDILNDIKKRTRRSSHTPTESLPTPSRAHFAATRTATYSAWTSPLSALSQKRYLKN